MSSFRHGPGIHTGGAPNDDGRTSDYTPPEQYKSRDELLAESIIPYRNRAANEAKAEAAAQAKAADEAKAAAAAQAEAAAEAKAADEAKAAAQAKVDKMAAAPLPPINAPPVIAFVIVTKEQEIGLMYYKLTTRTNTNLDYVWMYTPLFAPWNPSKCEQRLKRFEIPSSSTIDFGFEVLKSATQTYEEFNPTKFLKSVKESSDIKEMKIAALVELRKFAEMTDMTPYFRDKFVIQKNYDQKTETWVIFVTCDVPDCTAVDISDIPDACDCFSKYDFDNQDNTYEQKKRLNAQILKNNQNIQKMKKDLVTLNQNIENMKNEQKKFFKSKQTISDLQKKIVDMERHISELQTKIADREEENKELPTMINLLDDKIRTFPQPPPIKIFTQPGDLNDLSVRLLFTEIKVPLYMSIPRLVHATLQQRKLCTVTQQTAGKKYKKYFNKKSFNKKSFNKKSFNKHITKRKRSHKQKK